MAAGSTLRRWYTAAAVFVANAAIAVVVLNLLALPLVSREAAAPNAAAPPWVEEALVRVFPDWTADDRRTLLAESRRQYVYEPFTQFREREQTGRFVNVSAHGFRRSRDQGPWPPDPAYYNVFLFGGSTTFNLGVPDDATIASYLQAALARGGTPRPPRVYNFGRGAYYSSQERILFEQLALAGHVPDAAIFVDGLNDFHFWDDRPVETVPVRPLAGEAECPDPWREAFRRLPLARLLGSFAPRAEEGPRMPAPPEVSRPPAPDDPAVSARVIRRWVTNKRLVEGAAAALGVRVLFVWQPVPTYQTDAAQQVFHGRFGRHEYSRHGYPRMAEYVRRHDLGASFVWCADVQRGVDGLLYVDQVHYSPEMSSRVAACIAEQARARNLFG